MLQFFRDRPIQNLFPASSNLSAPQNSPLSSDENGSSEETHCSEDITSSTSDITSGNYDYTSGIQVDLNVQHPLTIYLMLSTLHTSSPTSAMMPQIPTTQPMASPPSILSPPLSHPSTLLLDYAPTPPTSFSFVPSPYSAALSTPPSAS